MIAYGSILLIGLLFLFIIFISYMRKYAHHKKIKWALGSYAVILVIALIAFQLIPDEGLNDYQYVDKETLERLRYEDMYNDLYNIAREGRLAETEGVQMNQEWTFEFAGEQLEVVDVDGRGIWVMAERRDTDDNKIQVIEYNARSIMSGIDFTDKIKPYDLTLQGNKLLVERPEEYRIEFITFRNDFIVSQFTDDGRNNATNSSRSFMGPRILMLSIPANLELDTSRYYIEIIGEQ